MDMGVTAGPDEPEKLGWSTVDDDGRRHHYSDDAGFEAGAVAPGRLDDPRRFDELVAVDLDEEERLMLVQGLNDWGGPAYGSDALAVAMGFASMDQLCAEAQVLTSTLRRSEPLCIRDWTRALVATELAFASTVLGTGPDEWGTINGGSDEHWLAVLTRLQSKVPADSSALAGR